MATKKKPTKKKPVKKLANKIVSKIVNKIVKKKSSGKDDKKKASGKVLVKKSKSIPKVTPKTTPKVSALPKKIDLKKIDKKASGKEKVDEKNLKNPSTQRDEQELKSKNKTNVVPQPKNIDLKESKPKDKKVSKKVNSEGSSAEEVEDSFEEEILLTDAEGNVICRVTDCDQVSQVDGYCRYHYLLFWKKIQSRKRILTEGKLERYIEELTARYPDKFLDVLKKDLRSQKEFLSAIQELEIEEGQDEAFDEEDSQNYLDEIRGVGDGVTPTRDEEDF
jgi:hypothetical protein